jgi:hypothetical protein
MKHKDELAMPGSRVRETHAATVLSIVGRDRMIPVTTGGTGFAMRGPFGWRAVAPALCRGERDPRTLAEHTRYGANTPAAINVAECGDDVPRRTYLALIGGASHEAFHRLYSQQGALAPETIRAAIAPVSAHPTVDWSKRAKLVMDLQNVVEDIYIERLGCAEYPGVRTKMADLADFIVRQEAEGRERAGNPPTTVVQAVFVAWRDRGLGYNTPTIRDNLARLAAECPQGVAMLRPGGALHDVFVRSIPDVRTPAARERAKRALLEGVSLRLALEAVALLEGAANGEGQGDGPKGDSPKGPKGPKGAKGAPAPKPSKDKDAEKADGSDKGEGGNEGKDADKADGPGAGGEPGDEAPAEGADGAGNGAAGDEPADAGNPGEGTTGEGTNSVDPSATDGEAKGSGGGEGTDPATAKDFLDGHSKDGKAGTLDSNSALEAAVKADLGEVSKDDNDPMPYRPYSTSHDEIVKVRASKDHAGSFESIKREARKGTAYLRTRLAVLFRALENSGTEHGVRKGPALSGRMLVDAYCEMRGGVMPTRAYMDRTPAVDMSIAAALVIDESASMRDKLRETCAAAYTLMDALDSIGAKSMAMGFRSKGYNAVNAVGVSGDYAAAVGCHRTHAMYYDVFKSWSEAFKTAAPRLREIRATGGTPMADGVEFALRELSSRPEGHRILFVLTDGQPDGSHGRVLKTQLQRAAEAGVLVVGVGLGYGSEYVQHTFPDSVYAKDLAALPALLVRKLEELVRSRATGAKRGRAVRAA